ncbi:MAG: hypothetical protein KAX80_16105, partial [Planctomycetes bacterium]|nr:hypothetical protein [Planctomycetota bacterium]
MRTYCCTVLSAVVLLVWMASVAPAQRPASPSTEEATPASVQLALSQGDLPGAVARYRALFQATDQLHLPSLRKLCMEALRRGLDSSSQNVQVQAGRGLKHAVDAETVPLLLDAVRQGKLTEEFVIDEPLQPVRTEGLLRLLKESLNDN